VTSRWSFILQRSACFLFLCSTSSRQCCLWRTGTDSCTN